MGVVLIDVSVPLRPGLPAWPGHQPFVRRVDRTVEESGRSTISTLTSDAHAGTHVDGPNHFLAGAPGADEIDLDACIGPAFVADLTDLDGHITSGALAGAGIPDGTTRLLAKTRNSGWSSEGTFREDFCAYDASAAGWCVDNGIRLLANDYLSIEPFGAGGDTHRVLLEAGVVIVEGLDLAGVEPGPCEVFALPIKVVDGDGAPARVVVRR